MNDLVVSEKRRKQESKDMAVYVSIPRPGPGLDKVLSAEIVFKGRCDSTQSPGDSALAAAAETP